MDISESGLLAVFDRSLDVWFTGQLSMVVCEQVVSIRARVARVNYRTAALAFQGMSDKNRAVIEELIRDANTELI